MATYQKGPLIFGGARGGGKSAQQLIRLQQVNAELLAALERVNEYASRQCSIESDHGALWAQCASIARAALPRYRSVP